MLDQVGLIGVGKMGRVILESLLKQHFTVVAFDPAPQARDAIIASGADYAQHPAEVVSRTAVTIQCLPAPQHIRESVFGPNGVLSAATPGRILVDTSTVDPETSREAASALSRKGTDYLDAPILGRPSTIGHWILPVGGEREAFERAQNVLRHFTKQIVYAGPSGAGNIFKLLNQLMFSAINGITAEVFAIAGKAGIDTDLFYRTVADSGAATVSGLFQECGRKITADSFEPVFPVDMLIKDAGLGIEMARRFGTPPVIASAVQVLNEIASGKGLGSLDTSVLVKVYQDLYAAHNA